MKTLLRLTALIALPLALAAGCTKTSEPDETIGQEMSAMGYRALFGNAQNGEIIYQEDGYAEVKSVTDDYGTRLLVIDPAGIDPAEAAEDGKIRGDDFKIIGRGSPAGATVLGENALKAKFYERHGLQM
jgi:hypothetical protein